VLVRRCYAAILVVLLVSVVSGSPAVENQEVSNICLGQEMTKDISQGGKYETNPMYENSYEKDTNIVRQVTGKVSDSRKMGIGALLVLIGSVLYAGFNWSEYDPY